MAKCQLCGGKIREGRCCLCGWVNQDKREEVWNRNSSNEELSTRKSFRIDSSDTAKKQKKPQKYSSPERATYLNKQQKTSYARKSYKKKKIPVWLWVFLFVVAISLFNDLLAAIICLIQQMVYQFL